MIQARPPIVLFCDFGLPYTGQMKARLGEGAPDHPIIDLFWDVPAHDVRAGSVLLAAHAADFPVGSVFVCVVDPGVGTAERRPGVVFAGGRWFVGPLNGLFEHVLRRWPEGAQAYAITWTPPSLSASFHGRDLFSPVAARLAVGDTEGLEPLDLHAVRREGFPDDVAQVVYVDGFGNLMTGIRASSLGKNDVLEVAGQRLARLGTFGEAESGALFCYENAVGLMEIAANRANAQQILAPKAETVIKIIRM
ncbi:MAG TPA: SAM-dependent chlorinase/fluorinase [Magnetovibrio sp.]